MIKEDNKRFIRTDKSTNAAASSSGTYYKRKLKIALYSHDTMGLGHMRRNLLISHTLANSSLKPSILLIAGSNEAGYFSMPAGVDCLTLPALRKELDGQYHSRHLGVSLKKMIRIRAKTIYAALEAFEPDVLIIDKEPLGANGELELALRRLRERGHTRFVLGLRDVLDEPVSMKQETRCESCSSKEDIIRHFYDAVWIYGDRNVYDLVNECGFSPDITSRVRYTGYLDQRMWAKIANPRDYRLSFDYDRKDKFVLCMVGGGQDGVDIAMAFAEAELPPETDGVLITGPFMLQEAKRNLYNIATKRQRFHVFEFLNNMTQLLSHADKVISMGGYNSICDVLSFEKQALIVPRVKPRLEQYVRAERLKHLELIDLLHPDKLNSQALTDWMSCDTKRSLSMRYKTDLNGLKRIPHMLEDVLNKT